MDQKDDTLCQLKFLHANLSKVMHHMEHKPMDEQSKCIVAQDLYQLSEQLYELTDGSEKLYNFLLRLAQQLLF